MAEQATYLRNLKSESVVQRVINCLTDGMISGELKPGDKLPTEPELAATFGVARTSVREATKILTYLGVLESRRSEGTFVANGFQDSMIDPMVYGIILNQGEDFNSLIELRELTEVGILRLAMKKSSAEDLEHIREKLEIFEEAAAGKQGGSVLEKAFQADNDFHDAVSALCKNDLVDKINLKKSERQAFIDQIVNEVRQHIDNVLQFGDHECVDILLGSAFNRLDKARILFG